MPTRAVHLIAAARPNFMKVAPLFHALNQSDWCRPVLIHTGQHYDKSMSENFMRDLRLPTPDFQLGIGSGTHAEQTAGVMLAYEKICIDQPPAWVVVVGDVNSTLACALVAAKLCIPLAHLEAGLRSGDRTMPEEINRVVTDAVSTLLWTPSPDAGDNLQREGIPSERIECVGNIMMDAYELLRQEIECADTRNRFGLVSRTYGLVTLHRPVNVDNKETLRTLTNELIETAQLLPLILPLHPRTRKRLEKFDLLEKLEAATNIQTTAPLSYVEFMNLLSEARLAITDSGGIQEETTYLNIPCITVRETTERPITLTQGTSRLARPQDISAFVQEIFAGRWETGKRPDLWDGKTADRVATSLQNRMKSSH
jgi:UDP-N-acetylglucosamine 2-epimerase (non-hydrolysing)